MENKTPDSAYVTKDNVVLMDDTTSLKGTAATQHTAKQTLVAADMATRAATAFGGASVGTCKRGK